MSEDYEITIKIKKKGIVRSTTIFSIKRRADKDQVDALEKFATKLTKAED